MTNTRELRSVPACASTSAVTGAPLVEEQHYPRSCHNQRGSVTNTPGPRLQGSLAAGLLHSKITEVL